MDHSVFGSSPVSPFLYEVTGAEDGPVSSPKVICRRPKSRLPASRNRIHDSALNNLTPVSTLTRPLAGTLSDPVQPFPGFSGKISFADIGSENRDPRVGSPMSISPLLSAREAKSSVDCDESQVKEALCKSELQPNLIGDFTSCHALPLISGQHQDLKTISVQTMASLIAGEFRDSVQEHLVVDCRYPYEFDGGHIVGALNIYTREGLVDKFFNHNSGPDICINKRRVIIFHCEFSSKRGPKLYRFTRSQDRQHNAVNYPHLTYPELYLLEGGYKAFYESFRHLCVPETYLPMEADQTALRQFQSQRSKSWTKEGNRRKGGHGVAAAAAVAASCGQRGYKRTTLSLRNFD